MGGRSGRAVLGGGAVRIPNSLRAPPKNTGRSRRLVSVRAESGVAGGLGTLAEPGAELLSANGYSSESQPVIAEMAAVGISDWCGEMIKNLLPGMCRCVTVPPRSRSFATSGLSVSTLAVSRTSVRLAGERESDRRSTASRSAIVCVASRNPSASCPSLAGGPPEKLVGCSITSIL